jgi:cation:H+ antiporter
MLMSLISLAAGTMMLYYGAEWIVKGSAGIARRLGLSSLVIGLTVVAFGTSLPELIISIIAAIEGSSSIAIGNVIGSNIANVGLVLGLSALIFPVSVNYAHLKRDMFVYLGACGLFVFFAFDGRLSRFEGAVLFIGLIFYILLCLKSPRGEHSEAEDRVESTSRLSFFVVAGITLLAFGADLFVDGAIYLARFIGVSEIVIGMSVVAFGTSLPELATSAMASFRNESAISVGNIIGSNIFNVLSVLGLASIISPLDSPKDIMFFEVPIMVGYGISMIVIAKLQQPVHRLISATLLIGYFIFIYLLF